MGNILLIDFGSTYTKVTAVDIEKEALLGTASSFTTVQTDINEGLENAVAKLRDKIGDVEFETQYACSSAAGGLRMMASGLVPELTAEAAKMASLGAGAKLLKTFAFEMTEEDIEEIDEVKPEIFLLVGGTDGGNSECIIHNAEMLSKCKSDFPIVIAGNRNAVSKCKKLLEGREYYAVENVMPKFGCLNILPAQEKIREIFLNRIIKAKGLSKASKLISGILMPTPAAIMSAMELLANGCGEEKGIGELFAVDVGGATTDVYSIAEGLPKGATVVCKGLPEPYSKRTVEGDIGMRYSLDGVIEAAGISRVAQISGLKVPEAEALIERLKANKDIIPDTEELKALDKAVACMAVETAAIRHAGTIEEVYTPTGLTFVQEGKDLSDVKHLVVTGGSLIYAEDVAQIASYALADEKMPNSLRPKEADVLVDKKYILAAMGILSKHYPVEALRIMKKELIRYGY